MSNTPILRFKGYVDNWENLLLGDIAEYSKGQGYSKNDLSEEGNPIILYGRLYTQYESTISEIDTFAEPRAGSVFSTGREVIIPASGETAEDIARASFVKQPGVLLGGDLNVLTPEQKIDPGFLALAISNGDARREISVRAQGKTVVHIHNDDIKEVHVSIPSDKAEQEKIAEIFGQVDKLITTQQRKCKKFVALKDACLDKMFPKKGSKVPELRFTGFTGDWEQRMVGKVCSISTGKSNTQDKIDDGEYPFYVRSPILERSNRYLYDEEAVLTVGDGVGTGKVFHYVKGKYDLHQRVYRLFSFSNDVDAKYFYHWFSKNFYDRVMSMTAKTSVDSVRLEMIAEMEMIAPSYQEQRKIASYLDNIDRLIILHQHKLKKLQQFKQAMMHNMFV